MTATSLFVVLALGFPPQLPPDFVQLTGRIDRAVIAGSAAQLEEVRQVLLRDLQKTPDDLTGLRRYALAYIDWRLNFLPKQAKRKEALLDEATKQLEQVIADDPTNAEALSLLGAVYGARIDGIWSGMTLGPKAGEMSDRASASEPNNPRVALQKGVSAYFTPSAFGGGIEKAERELLKAQRLFAKQRSGRWPNWGELDVLAWRGQILAKRGDREAARAVYQQALAAAPDFTWVRNVLLPALDSPRRAK